MIVDVRQYRTVTLRDAVGLDPAGPWFSANDSLLRIDIGDALYVDTINTDGLGFISFGLGEVIGHVDFFPNNARRQPPCPEPCEQRDYVIRLISC